MKTLTATYWPDVAVQSAIDRLHTHSISTLLGVLFYLVLISVCKLVSFLCRLAVVPLPRLCAGLFSFRSYGRYTLHNDLSPRVFRVKPPVYMALFDLPVILIDQALHQIKDQTLIQIRTAGSIIDPHNHPQIPSHQGYQRLALLFKHLTIVQGFLAFDQSRHVAKTHHFA